MSGGATPVPAGSPLMQAWEAYKATDDYKNTRKWALQEEHVDGSLWAAFACGFAHTQIIVDTPVPEERHRIDAARYRWLRDVCAYEAWVAYVTTPPAAMDAAIDNGMAAASGRTPMNGGPLSE